MGCGMRSCANPHLRLSVHPWEGHSVALGLSFYISKMGEKTGHIHKKVIRCVALGRTWRQGWKGDGFSGSFGTVLRVLITSTYFRPETNTWKRLLASLCQSSPVNALLGSEDLSKHLDQTWHYSRQK